MKWLALDPGLLNCGYAVGRYRETPLEQKMEVLAGGCLTQPKAPKKLNLKAPVDDFNRSAKLTKKLAELMDLHQPEVICYESFSPPRNSSSAGKMGRAYGVISALAELARLPVVAVSPQEVKLAVAGRKSASKSEIRGALSKLYGAEAIDILCKGVNKQHQEHPVDALGVLHASLETAVFRMGSKMPVEE